jgi:hypothetical protein
MNGALTIDGSLKTTQQHKTKEKKIPTSWWDLFLLEIFLRKGWIFGNIY